MNTRNFLLKSFSGCLGSSPTAEFSSSGCPRLPQLCPCSLCSLHSQGHRPAPSLPQALEKEGAGTHGSRGTCATQPPQQQRPEEHKCLKPPPAQLCTPLPQHWRYCAHAGSLGWATHPTPAAEAEEAAHTCPPPQRHPHLLLQPPQLSHPAGQTSSLRGRQRWPPQRRAAGLRKSTVPRKT